MLGAGGRGVPRQLRWRRTGRTHDSMEADVGTAGGTPLDALTAKVEELGRVCAQLGQENAELRAQVLSLRGGTARSGAWLDAQGARGSGPEGTVTRGARG